MKFFNTTHSSLDEVFGANKTYTIPAYQRPYSWQSLGKTDQNNQVNRMWDDLWEFFQESEKDKEYFLGSMVVIQQQEARSFEVVDGQQRLTTIALLFAAMSCFLKDHCTDPELAKFRQQAISRLEELTYNYTGVTLVQTLKVKILRAAGYDYNEVMARAVSCAKTSGVTDARYAEIADRYFLNREYFSARLREHFLSGDTFTIKNAENFNEFFSFLNVRVAIVLITTTSFETAFMIFETLNNRGLPLTNLDLLRNLLLKELTEADVDDPKGLWTTLEEESLTEDFVGRWVESFAAQHQRSSAFSDLLKIYQTEAFKNLPGEPRALRFYTVFRRDLGYFGLIREPWTRVSDSVLRNKIRFLRVAGNDRYSLNLMLALFRQVDYAGGKSEVVLDFLCTYQRFLLHMLLSPGARFSNAGIYKSIAHLRAGNVGKAKEIFSLDQESSRRLVGYLSGEIPDNATAKLLLAEYVWHEEATTTDVVTQELRWSDASLEHIVPQTPAAGSQWTLDFSDTFRKEYTYRLGNMTLLTTRMNAAAKNYEFAKKKEQYKRTLLPLTKELATLDPILPAHVEARHERIVAGILRSLQLVTPLPRL